MSQYKRHVKSGPFPGRIDPWAEQGQYFHPLHNSMIGAIIDQIQDPLFDMGYATTREKSLQIAENREPDVQIRRDLRSDPPALWRYETAAVEVLAHPGVLVQDETELDAIHIYRLDSGSLVTVLEIVSPNNKLRSIEIIAYRERRARLYLERGVNVVEIDLTRSVKRLASNTLTEHIPYHVAVFLPDEGVYIIEYQFEDALGRIALPLRAEVIPVELQAAYDRAYQQAMTAWHINDEGKYTEEDLPFPSLLKPEQRQQALEAVKNWQRELAVLRPQ